MPTDVAAIRARVTSLCCGAAFAFTPAVNPFDFDRQPTGQIDRVFRIQADAGSVIGGFNYSEERTDHLEIWLARKQQGDPRVTYQQLLTDASSIRAAVIRDGATGGGDYTVPDGGGFSVNHDAGREFAVLRLIVPINYEAQV